MDLASSSGPPSARSRTPVGGSGDGDSDSGGVRGSVSRSRVLRSLAELAPMWQPWRMNREERQAWYNVGGIFYDSVCTNSKEWALVGRKLENTKQFEDAASCYCRSIRLNPHCAAYYFRLGCTQCELAEWSSAIESFHLAIAIAPDYAHATYYFNLGYAHSEMRSWAEAIEAITRAIELKPNKHVYHNLIAVCHRHASDYEQAIFHYKRAIAQDRIQPAYRRNLAYVYMQLKQWGRAVKAWSGAIETAPPKYHPELYRNRAFAQAERGYLAMACQDMAHAHSLYTATQQRKRCREKLERWTSRLQGTEQAYLRAQQQLALERADGHSSSDDGGHVKRRTKMRQMAGLIQGEWEEWHGEDRDASGASSDENDADRHPSRRKRLNMTKRSRLAPASTRLIRAPDLVAEDEARFSASSSSAYIRNLIAEVGLDRPFAEKQAEEQREWRREERRVKREARAARTAERDERRAARARRAQDAADHPEEAEVAAAESSSSSSGGGISSCESSSHSDEEGPSSPSARARGKQRRRSTGSLLSAPADDPEDDLYADDHFDPFSSLAKLFIRLRIDSKYLWRFEAENIHLNNIHRTTEEDMKRVLPPLGPRLTLMNFLKDRVTRLRAAQGLAPAESSQASNEVDAATKPSIEWQWSRGSDRQAEAAATHRQEAEAAAARITSTFRRRRASSPSRGISASPSPTRSSSSTRTNGGKTPTPSNPINPSPIVPVSPHNAVLVGRPLTARDRRTLYDAHTNARSAMTPIRTSGSAAWK